jgi:hypothetical protein
MWIGLAIVALLIASLFVSMLAYPPPTHHR